MEKKKTLAIVLGIFALVIVTTAASFAFFTYSRTGNTKATIISGDIEFSYIEGDSAELTKAFPVSDEIGAIDESGEYEFQVKLNSNGTTTASYNVYLVDNNTGTNHFTNEQIKFALIKNDVFVANTSSTEGVKLSTLDGFDEGSSKGEGIVLSDQEISSGETDNYKLRIWISDDVSYNNTYETDGTMTGRYNSYTYSLKVKVTSGASNVENSLTKLEIEGGHITANLSDPNGLSAYAVTQSSSTPSENEWIEITSDTAKSNIVRTADKLITKKTINYQIEETGRYYLHVKNKNNKISTQVIDVETLEYKESILNGTEPVLTDNLVPVMIDNTGKVTKANLNDKWYDYDEKIWANAVVLKTETEYQDGAEIPESNIESYFVWIPKYSYKIWDLGNYNSVTAKENKEQEIKIRFGTANTSDKVNGECTTPMNEDKTQALAGESGNCNVGEYMTHPAFISFDTTGMWVGKFETGYDGATSKIEAQINSHDASKIIIKPNVYSWRWNTLGNMFKASLEYLESNNSHMMKNTEWGAAAYLQHSKYGSMISVRVNNNNDYITGYSSLVEPTIGYNGGKNIEGNINESTSLGEDGKNTVNYFNPLSAVSSTTGNYSGVYDMSGGCWEYIAGYTETTTIGGLSEITKLYPDFFNDSTYTKYWDGYPSSTSGANFYFRILGDATGEIGPFQRRVDPDTYGRYGSSWYEDHSQFPKSNSPWFYRGGSWHTGVAGGIFAFDNYSSGGTDTTIGFRIVLAPTK